MNTWNLHQADYFSLNPMSPFLMGDLCLSNYPGREQFNNNERTRYIPSLPSVSTLLHLQNMNKMIRIPRVTITETIYGILDLNKLLLLTSLPFLAFKWVKNQVLFFGMCFWFLCVTVWQKWFLWSVFTNAVLKTTCASKISTRNSY